LILSVKLFSTSSSEESRPHPTGLYSRKGERHRHCNPMLALKGIEDIDLILFSVGSQETVWLPTH
jgi:hypothetical protein